MARATCLIPLSSALAKTPHQAPLGSVGDVLWGTSAFGGRETELTGDTPKPPLLYVGLTGALILNVPHCTLLLCCTVWNYCPGLRRAFFLLGFPTVIAEDAGQGPSVHPVILWGPGEPTTG